MSTMRGTPAAPFVASCGARRLTAASRVLEDAGSPSHGGWAEPERQDYMRRRTLALLAVAVLALVTAGQAAAFHCFVVKKPIGAGSAATLTFDVLSGGEPDFASLPFNPNSERVEGGFITLRIVAGTTEIGTWDILFQNT